MALNVICADGEAAKDIVASLAHYGDYVASQTLSLKVEFHPMAEAPSDAAEVEWGDEMLKIKITKN